MNIDFVKHVALIAVVAADGGDRIVGGGRYIVGQPGEAELAFMVVDQYQGKGIGAALLRHLIVIARHGGLRELSADVLADNTSMLKVFERSGFRISPNREHKALHIPALMTCIAMTAELWNSSGRRRAGCLELSGPPATPGLHRP